MTARALETAEEGQAAAPESAPATTKEMAHGMYALKGGSLLQKLNWMVVEGSSYKLVKPLLGGRAASR